MKKNTGMMPAVMLVCLILLSSTVWSQQRVRNVNPRMSQRGQVQDLTPEQEKEVLDYLKVNFPQQLTRLTDLETRRPAVYKNAVAKQYRNLKLLESIKERDPERYDQLIKERQLEADSQKLAREYKLAATDAEKADIKTRLEKLLWESFDYRQLNRQKEIERLEQKLEELKRDNQVKIDNKKEVVDRQLQKLLGERSALEW